MFATRFTHTALLMTFVAALAMLTGCDGGGNGTNGGGGSGGNGGGSSGGNGGAKTGPDGKVEVVRYGMLSSKIRGLDPMDIGDTTSSGIGSNFYEPLYQYHYLKRDPFVLIPALAADMPEFSEDKLTLTIPIRQDVFFHDNECFPGGQGRKLVAQDFIYGWMRIAYVKNVSKNWWLLEDLIVGLDEFRDATKETPKAEMKYDQEIEGLKAVDDFTLQIKLKKPAPDFLYRLAHLPTAPVPREAVEHYGEEFLNHAVGTGAFMLDKWTRGSRITMVRNPKFREERYPTEGAPGDEEAGLLVDAGKQIPFIDRAEFSVIVEDQPYWLTFLKGHSDRAGIPKDNFGQAISADFSLNEDMRSKGIQLTKFAEPTTFWLGMNMKDKVLGKNLPLRQALNLAHDRMKFIKLFTNNRSVPARGALPPSIPDYNPDLNTPYTTFNLAKAKQKAEEAKALHRKMYNEDLPPISIVIPGTDATSIQHGQSYKRDFEAAGIPIKLETMDWPSAQEKVKKASAQVFAYGWIMDWPDSLNMMLLWYGPFESPGANNTNYQNPEFDKLYDQVAKMVESPERTKLIRRMEQIVVDDLPNVFSTHRRSFVLQYDWFKNYKPHVFGYGMMKYSNIDMARRIEKVGR